MRTWKAIVACMGLLACMGSFFALADTHIQNQIDDKIDSLRALIERVYHRVDRIDDKVDRILEKGE